MSWYWNHGDNLDEPPTASALTCRRPWGKTYWETTCFGKVDALEEMWKRWENLTGRKVPSEVRTGRPVQPKYDHAIPTSRKMAGERRPDTQKQKGEI